MIELGNIQIEFKPPEDWEYSADPLELKSFKLSIDSDRLSFNHEVSFEGSDSPLNFFQKLANRSHDDLHWQSLCQEFFLKSEYRNEEYEAFDVTILSYNDSDNFDSSCALELSLTVAPDEIIIDIPKLIKLFGNIRCI